MATLQTSGAISLNDVKTTLGGLAAPSLSNYYRGGTYVKSSRTVNDETRQPSSGGYYSTVAGFYSYWTASEGGGTPEFIGYEIMWQGSSIRNSSSVNAFSYSSYTVGNVTYYRGTYLHTSQPSNIRAYEVYRRVYTTTTQSINTGVPSSGQISLASLYGATT